MRNGKIIELGALAEKAGLKIGIEVGFYNNVGTEMNLNGDKVIFLEGRDIKGIYETLEDK